ncbi:short-chain dehydrogenase [Aeromicrobium sp. Root495]|uniref:SDR family oxidoreductase n=1 Tax=Aeromicrobium sp. Root495 TaxID=1736550 RepID=UPI0006FE20D3|nr:NAD(P)-dependent oxidoreductase [Aeromicrobium sp. Root495]KQY56001.1 short-chain dehydrogenase [Aeromicrobium sp. Root495]RYJ06957.1 MAG: NAD(P)-dependent oxidoreductase [Actinomycetales bacterium]
MSLAGKTIIMSGGSRGIGEAIAVRAARDGANVALLAKTAEPHPVLPGTIYTAAQAVIDAGGQALPLVGDVRDDAFVEDAVARTAEKFGGIDIVVNNASAIDLSSTADISMKKYDLMLDINARGSFLLSKLSLPWLKQSDHGHVLTLSPPISTDPRWFGTFTAYAMAKYAMSLVTLGLSEELRADGIAANSLWPRTAIDTAAVRNVVGAGLEAHSRTPQIMADAAYEILVRPPSEQTGQFLIDDDVLEAAGVTDFSVYLNGGTEEGLALDFWVDPKGPHDPSLRL